MIFLVWWDGWRLLCSDDLVVKRCTCRYEGKDPCLVFEKQKRGVNWGIV